MSDPLDNSNNNRENLDPRDSDKYDREVEWDIRELKGLREQSKETLIETMLMSRELTDAHLDLTELLEDHYEFLEDRDISGKLADEYADLLDGHIDTLEDEADSLRSKIYRRIAAGTASVATGLSIANFYLPDQNLFGFYSQYPEIYSESPEIGLATVGLPALGLYAIKKSSDYNNELNELERELGDYKRRKNILEGD